MLLAQTLLQNLSKNMTKPAWRWLGKETLTKDMLHAISRLSYLYVHEIGQEQRVAFFTSNSPAVITTFFALTNTRSVVIPVDPSLPQEEVAKWIKDAQATHIAVTSDLLQQARELVSNQHLNLPLIEIEKKKGGEYDTSFTPQPDNPPKETDVILLLRTAGTTGKPKFVSFTHKQLQNAVIGMRTLYRVMPTDRFITQMHWSHPFAFTHGMLVPLMSGACVVIDHGLQALEFLDFLVESRVTRLVGTPSFFLKILVICRNEKRLLPGIKSVTVGIGPLEPAIKKTFDVLKIPVLHVYGQTENLWTLAMNALPTDEGGKKEGSAYVRGEVGTGLMGYKYKVMDDQGDEVEDTGKGAEKGKMKRVGQLAMSGPTIMAGYLGLEKETKNALRGTWLYTGDIVEISGEGETLQMRYICRKADVFKADGKIVDFHQIDTVLKSVAGLQDAAAFAVKNAKDKLVLVCAAIKKAGVQVSEKQVLETISTKLTPELVPAAVAFTDEIPRDKGGNVNLHKLRGQFSGIAG